jgi:DNA polymerase-3 subunit beta
MTLTVDREQLSWALDECARLRAPRRARMPWQGRVRLSQSDGTLRLAVTDTDASVEAEIPAAGGGISGPAVVTLRGLRGLVRLLDADDVALQVSPATDGEPRRLAVEAGGEWTFVSFDPDDFPVLPEVAAEAGAVELKADTVAQLRRVIPAAAPADGHPLLAHVHVAGGRAVATDSYRLAVAELGEETRVLPELLIPAAVLRAALRVDDGWAAATDGTGLRLTREGVAWTTRLGEGKYPDVDRVLPADPGPPLRFERLAVVRALRRSMAVLDIRSTSSPAILTTDGDTLTIETTSADEGRALERVPVEGDLPYPLGVNRRLLLEGLGTLRSDTATVHVDAAPPPGGKGEQYIERPILFVEDGFRYLQMPVRL